LEKVKPITCRRCKCIVAHTDGPSIYFGSFKVPLVATGLMFLCPECKAAGKWKASDTTPRQKLVPEREM
jgi:hypothetical protein